MNKAKKDDFVFVDPPYDGNTFTSYTSSSFDSNQQKILANKLKELDKKGVLWIATNHNTKKINDLYEEYNKMVLSADRYISSNAAKRKSATQEIFIWNYKSKFNPKDQEIHQYLSSLLTTNNRLSDFTEWSKIETNVKNVEFAINDLNYLVGSRNESDLIKKVKELFERQGYESFKYLNLLLAKRPGDEKEYYFNPKNTETIEYKLDNFKDISTFITGTKLINLFSKIINLKDYVFGVEVGLDSHSRKNRSGKIMEKTIATLLLDAKINFKEQIKLEKLNINSKGSKANKLVDFSFKFKNEDYIIESSFYNTGGSKINETLKSFVTLTNDAKKHNIKLIWIADGKGMKTIQKHLADKWGNIKIMSISQFKEFINN